MLQMNLLPRLCQCLQRIGYDLGDIFDGDIFAPCECLFALGARGDEYVWLVGQVFGNGLQAYLIALVLAYLEVAEASAATERLFSLRSDRKHRSRLA